MTDALAASRPAEILLVEDNEDDVFLTRMAFEQAKLIVNLHHVDDGEKCMAFLRKQPPYADAPTPDLILLDLNLPVMDGREVLAEIVKDEALKHLAVVVLTTSYEAEDIATMYKLRCNSYITKPVDFEKFVDAVRKLQDYWFTVVILPTVSTPPGGPRRSRPS
ncbi:MAG TPA: response regulator [Burkholderiales bacterium]|nr:response regulator [Burkholderiales bacterium]